MSKNLNDLQELWKNQPIQQGEINMEMILKKSNDFKKSVMWRNFRECGIALLLIPVFGRHIFTAKSTWAMLMNIEITAALIFVCVHIYMYGRNHKAPDYSASSTAHLSFLRLQLQTQMKLLKNVNAWYLLPLIAGVLGLQGEAVIKVWATGTFPALELALVGVTLALYVGILWLNTVWGVRKLQKQIDELPQV